MAKNKSNPVGVNIGTSSLLLVFVILCLVSFATLSFVSANADKKLTDKVVERTTSYYEACNQAEERIAGIDATLKTLYDSGVNREEYFKQAGEKIDFAIPVSNVQTLNVSVKTNYPTDAGESFYTIDKWILETTGILEEEEPQKLNLLF